MYFDGDTVLTMTVRVGGVSNELVLVSSKPAVLFTDSRSHEPLKILTILYSHHR